MANSIIEVKQIAVANGAGYWDLLLTKSANGKAVRIANRFNSERVHITLDSVDNLINALQLVKASGIPMSVEDTEYDTQA